MIKKIIFTIIILTLITSNAYTDYYSELIDKILCIEKQREEREPIELKIKGRGYNGEDTVIVYITSVMRVRRISPLIR